MTVGNVSEIENLLAVIDAKNFSEYNLV
jgi:hypothetical protein